MPKDPKSEFGDTWNYPYYSVCTTSTHDMGGIRLWWENDRSVSQRYFNNVLHETGEAPVYAEPWICGKIITLQLKSPSMLCILPLQDWLSTDSNLRRQNPAEEQINMPANPRPLLALQDTSHCREPHFAGFFQRNAYKHDQGKRQIIQHNLQRSPSARRRPSLRNNVIWQMTVR